jgi:hypothetical protein
MIGFDMLLRPSHLTVKSSLNIRPTLLRRLIRKFGYADANQQLKWIRGDLYERARKPLTSKSKGRTFPATMESMTGLVHRLLRGEPLAYVLGTPSSVVAFLETDFTNKVTSHSARSYYKSLHLCLSQDQRRKNGRWNC